MATYFNYGEGEEEATVQGAEWLKGVIGQVHGNEAEVQFIEKFKEYHDNIDHRKPDYGPVFDHFLANSADLFTSIPEHRADERLKEIESFFALVFSQLLLLSDTNHLSRATTQLCELFSKDTTQADLRLRLLMMLYNSFGRYLLDYAARASLFDQILPYLEYLDAWLADWDTHLTPADKRALFRDISTYMRKMNKRSDAFQYLKRYHGLFKGEEPKELATPEVSKMTVQLLTDAIQLPFVIQFDDLLSFETVQALAKSKSAGSELTQLCQVFLSGTVNDLRDFHKKNEKVFSQHDLCFQDCMSKIRLLTLATLAQGRSEMALGEVAKALEESEDNVEPWVVRAISEGVIDGRIDQLNRKVLVKSSFQRKFAKEEWSFLDTKLTQWIDNLESVLKFIGDQKALKEVETAKVA